jgi:aminoacylase
LLLKDTAGEKARILLDRFMDFRANEVKKLENNPALTVGDVTTVNLVIMSGGVQTNVVPPDFTLCFDIRVAVDVNLVDLENLFYEWCAEAGGGIVLEYEQKSPYVAPTSIDDSNPFWKPFKEALDEM